MSRPTRPMARALAVASLALMGSLLAVPSAAGHASQTGSSPAAGAVLDAAPSSVEVTFDTPLMDVGAALVVRSEDGTVVSGAPEVDRTAIRVAVPADATQGRYAVAFRVVSQDGHPITSAFDYTVAGEAPTHPAPPSADAPAPGAVPTGVSSPGPPYALIAGGLLVLTLIGVGAIALRR